MSAAPDGDLALKIDESITCDDLRRWRVYWHSPILSFRLSVSYPTPGELLVEKFDVARWKMRIDRKGVRYSGRFPEVSVCKVTMLVNAWRVYRKGRRRPSYCYLLAISHESASLPVGSTTETRATIFTSSCWYRGLVNLATRRINVGITGRARKQIPPTLRLALCEMLGVTELQRAAKSRFRAIIRSLRIVESLVTRDAFKIVSYAETYGIFCTMYNVIRKRILDSDVVLFLSWNPTKAS